MDNSWEMIVTDPSTFVLTGCWIGKLWNYINVWCCCKAYYWVCFAFGRKHNLCYLTYSCVCCVLASVLNATKKYLFPSLGNHWLLTLGRFGTDTMLLWLLAMLVRYHDCLKTMSGHSFQGWHMHDRKHNSKSDLFILLLPFFHGSFITITSSYSAVHP